MSYHVLAYTAVTHAVTAHDTTPVEDLWPPIQNGHFFPDRQLMLFGGAFFGADLTKVTLVTPRSRLVVPPVLYPVVGALLPPDRPHIFDRRSNPFTLAAVEEVSMLVDVGGAANEDIWLVEFWGDRMDPVPAGDIYCLHGTSTTTTTAGAWTQIAVTWDQTIPAGRYAVIGSQHVSTDAIAHRFYFPGQLMRPGFLSMVSLQNIGEPSYYYGGWGKLGEFVTYSYPTVEVLTDLADSAHDLVMCMIKIG